jgi:hypothetical protein
MRQWAEESVAPRFTRIMRAATSRYGVLTDPPLIAVVESVLTLSAIALYQMETITSDQLIFVWITLAAPLLLGTIVSITQFGARSEVVSWLASQPFPIENFNGLLNGVAVKLVIRFEDDLPERVALNDELEVVGHTCFALDYEPSEHEVEVNIGVADSKINPASANHRRYERVRELVERVLVPLAKKRGIVRVHIC